MVSGVAPDVTCMMLSKMVTAALSLKIQPPGNEPEGRSSKELQEIIPEPSPSPSELGLYMGVAKLPKKLKQSVSSLFMGAR